MRASGGLTGDVLAVVDAPVDGAEGAAGDDPLDDQLRRVDLPLLPRLTGVAAAVTLLLLLHGPGPAQVPLQLLVQCLQIYLVRPDKAAPGTATVAFHRRHRRPVALSRGVPPVGGYSSIPLPSAALRLPLFLLPPLSSMEIHASTWEAYVSSHPSPFFSLLIFS